MNDKQDINPFLKGFFVGWISFYLLLKIIQL